MDGSQRIDFDTLHQRKRMHCLQNSLKSPIFYIFSVFVLLLDSWGKSTWPYTSNVTWCLWPPFLSWGGYMVSEQICIRSSFLSHVLWTLQGLLAHPPGSMSERILLGVLEFSDTSTPFYSITLTLHKKYCYEIFFGVRVCMAEVYTPQVLCWSPNPHCDRIC